MDSGAQRRAAPGKLQRGMGLGAASLVIVANMVGVGIFTTSGYAIQALGNAWLLLASWLLGGVIALSGAMSYAELGARLPRAGGEYAFLRQSLGPLAAFMSGWISLVVGFSAPIAASAVAAGAYLLQALPGGGPSWSCSWGGLGLSAENLLALGLISAMTLVHTRRVGMGLRVQNVLTLLKILVLLCIIAAALALWPLDEPWPLSPVGGSGRFPLAGMAVALIFVSFAYSGFNAAAYLGEEIIRPERNLPRAIVLGTGAVVLLYLLLNVAYLAALGPGGLSGVKEVGAMTAKALWGPGVGGVFSLVMGLCLLSGLGAMILTGPRVYFAMARDGVFPSALARVRESTGAPACAVLLQSAIAAFMVLTTTFAQLLFYIGFTLSLFTALSVAGLFVLRRRQGPAPFSTPGWPVTPLLFIVANLSMVVYSLVGNPWRGLPALLTVLAGLVVYVFFRGGNSRSSGPVSARSGP